jgi:hypothetical protein
VQCFLYNHAKGGKHGYTAMLDLSLAVLLQLLVIYAGSEAQRIPVIIR